MLLGRFFINKDTRRMELEHLEELDEKVIENVTSDHDGLTIVYSNKENKKDILIID